MPECYRKTRFASRDEAREKLDQIHKTPELALATLKESGKMPVRAYCCPRCYGWHLTSKAKYTKEVIDN